MPFTPEEIVEIQEALDEAYGYIALPFVLKQLNRTATPIDKLYGESKNKAYTEYTMSGSIVVKPETKVLKKWGLSEDSDLLVVVTRTELLRNNVEVTTTDRLIFQGTEYYVKHIVKDTELPIENELNEIGTDYLSLAISASTR